MKPFSVKEIRLCVNGQLIQGSDEFMVNDIIYHITEDGAEQINFLKTEKSN